MRILFITLCFIFLMMFCKGDKKRLIFDKEEKSIPKYDMTIVGKVLNKEINVIKVGNIEIFQPLLKISIIEVIHGNESKNNEIYAICGPALANRKVVELMGVYSSISLENEYVILLDKVPNQPNFFIEGQMEIDKEKREEFLKLIKDKIKLYNIYQDINVEFFMPKFSNICVPNVAKINLKNNSDHDKVIHGLTFKIGMPETLGSLDLNPSYDSIDKSNIRILGFSNYYNGDEVLIKKKSEMTLYFVYIITEDYLGNIHKNNFLKLSCSDIDGIFLSGKIFEIDEKELTNQKMQNLNCQYLREVSNEVGPFLRDRTDEAMTKITEITKKNQDKNLLQLIKTTSAFNTSKNNLDRLKISKELLPTFQKDSILSEVLKQNIIDLEAAIHD